MHNVFLSIKISISSQIFSLSYGFIFYKEWISFHCAKKNIISPMQYIIQILCAFSNHTGIDFDWFYLTEETQNHPLEEES